MHDEYSDVLKRAMAWANENRPNASPQHKAAFANSVAYAVTGWSGGYGGPSVREHAATRAIHEAIGDNRPFVTGKQITDEMADGILHVVLCGVLRESQETKEETASLGFMPFEQAVNLLGDENGVVFGPVTDLHHTCWKCEHCFDDDPEDIRALVEQ